MTAADPQKIEAHLQRHGQQHLLRFRNELTATELSGLLEQIALVDFDLIATSPDQSRAAESADDSKSTRADRAAAPQQVIRQPRSETDTRLRTEAAAAGEELLAEGRVAVITVAGGQGTRLGLDQPKGMFPIGPCSDRTLFQIFAEQILARRRRHGAALPWYLMTSEVTHADTQAFFALHNYFDLSRDTVFFFRQGNLPAVDADSGAVLMSSRSALCSSPDGHGGMVAALKNSGCLQQMAGHGIEHLFYHQVDNPTVILCDPVMLGLHAQRRSQITTNVVHKTDASERMGVLVDLDSRTEIIEYSELTPEQTAACDADGQWIFWAGNTAIHVFRRDFLEYLTEEGIRLPLHQARKKVVHIDTAGRPIEPMEPNAIKFERFIFDALPMAERTLIVEGDRQQEFNPVKNADGQDSPETARAALSAIGRQWLQEAGYVVPGETAVEISPLIALDAKELTTRLTQGDVTVNDLVCGSVSPFSTGR